MKAKDLTILAVCLVGAILWTSAGLGADLGIQPDSDLQDDINKTNQELENIDANPNDPTGVTSAFNTFRSVVTLLGQLEPILINLGLPPIAAQVLTLPTPILIGYAIIQLVLRVRF